MILGGWLPGKVDSCRNCDTEDWKIFGIVEYYTWLTQGKCDILITEYSSLAQLAERVTVNHDVAGSSPAGGAKRPILSVFFFIIKEK